MRQCTKCGEIKRLEDFPSDGNGTGRTGGQCRECERAQGRRYYEANQEKRREEAASGGRETLIACARMTGIAIWPTRIAATRSGAKAANQIGRKSWKKRRRFRSMHMWCRSARTLHPGPPDGNGVFSPTLPPDLIRRFGAGPRCGDPCRPYGDPGHARARDQGFSPATCGYSLGASPGWPRSTAALALAHTRGTDPPCVRFRCRRKGNLPAA